MLYVENDTRRYQKLLKMDHGPIPTYNRAEELPTEQAGLIVVTGDKTADYGGGRSPWGFIVDRTGEVVARVHLDALKSGRSG